MIEVGQYLICLLVAVARVITSQCQWRHDNATIAKCSVDETLPKVIVRTAAQSGPDAYELLYIWFVRGKKWKQDNQPLVRTLSRRFVISLNAFLARLNIISE